MKPKWYRSDFFEHWTQVMKPKLIWTLPQQVRWWSFAPCKRFMENFNRGVGKHWLTNLDSRKLVIVWFTKTANPAIKKNSPKVIEGWHYLIAMLWIASRQYHSISNLFRRRVERCWEGSALALERVQKRRFGTRSQASLRKRAWQLRSSSPSKANHHHHHHHHHHYHVFFFVVVIIVITITITAIITIIIINNNINININIISSINLSISIIIITIT